MDTKPVRRDQSRAEGLQIGAHLNRFQRAAPLHNKQQEGVEQNTAETFLSDRGAQQPAAEAETRATLGLIGHTCGAAETCLVCDVGLFCIQ